MNDWLIAAGYIVAYLLGNWVGWYGLHPPQLRWPWHYSEADAYAKKYCSDEQALARASEEAWQQARVGKDRTMGPLVVGNWPPKSLYERVTALEEEVSGLKRLHCQNFNRIQALKSATPFDETHKRILSSDSTATPSPPTASPTTGSPSGAAERDYTPRLSPASWRSDQQIMDAGLVTRVYESAEE